MADYTSSVEQSESYGLTPAQGVAPPNPLSSVLNVANDLAKLGEQGAGIYKRFKANEAKEKRNSAEAGYVSGANAIAQARGNGTLTSQQAQSKMIKLADDALAAGADPSTILNMQKSFTGDLAEELIRKGSPEEQRRKTLLDSYNTLSGDNIQEGTPEADAAIQKQMSYESVKAKRADSIQTLQWLESIKKLDAAKDDATLSRMNVAEKVAKKNLLEAGQKAIHIGFGEWQNHVRQIMVASGGNPTPQQINLLVQEAADMQNQIKMGVEKDGQLVGGLYSAQQGYDWKSEIDNQFAYWQAAVDNLRGEDKQSAQIILDRNEKLVAGQQWGLLNGLNGGQVQNLVAYQKLFPGSDIAGVVTNKLGINTLLGNSAEAGAPVYSKQDLTKEITQLTKSYGQQGPWQDRQVSAMIQGIPSKVASMLKAIGVDDGFNSISYKNFDALTKDGPLMKEIVDNHLITPEIAKVISRQVGDYFDTKIFSVIQDRYLNPVVNGQEVLGGINLDFKDGKILFSPNEEKLKELHKKTPAVVREGPFGYDYAVATNKTNDIGHVTELAGQMTREVGPAIETLIRAAALGANSSDMNVGWKILSPYLHNRFHLEDNTNDNSGNE